MSNRIAIIGTGQVGASAAYALLLANFCSELLLIDVNITKRDGQVQDLSDAACCAGISTHIRSASLKEAGQCDIIIIALGCRQRLGESRLQSTWRNGANMVYAIREMKPLRDDAIIVVVSNPNDFLTHLAVTVSELPTTQVFGAGTYLSTVRLRGMLASKTALSADSMEIYVLGENSDEQFVAWSSAAVSGVPLNAVLSPGAANRSELGHKLKQEGQRIIKAKGAITFGIASVIVSICSAILLDRRTTCSVSHLQPEMGCCLSLPVALGREGILETFPISFNREERTRLEATGKELKAEIERMEGELLSVV